MTDVVYTFLAILGGLLTLVSTAGAGFYFIGRLSARVDGHEQRFAMLEQRIARQDDAVDRIYQMVDSNARVQDAKRDAFRAELLQIFQRKE